MKKSELNSEDLQRVEDYLSSNPLHQKERQGFKLGRLFVVLVGVVSLLSVISLLIGRLYFGEL